MAWCWPDAPALIQVVTLNFTANGGDGYPVKANGDNFRYLLTDGTLSAPVSEALDFTAPANVPANALGEQQAFARLHGRVPRHAGDRLRPGRYPASPGYTHPEPQRTQ